MKKEVFDKIKKELLCIGLLLVVFIVIFKIMFYKERFMVVIRTVASLFWLYALPGYFLMIYWHEKLDFTERFAIGIAMALAILGIFSYYLGISGLDIKYHAILLPLILIGAGLLVSMRK